ncbi:MAG TPA: hypothetical protein VLG48_12075, partial [Candidatus Methylomirabilis sp.]|nr:hypothetical protein [Candidatus Methylomirabilis sp.]
MDRSPPPPQFPSRIGRRLSVALAAIIASVLLIGGISLVLALRIFQINMEVDRENTHILVTDQIHTTFHRIVFELQQMNAMGWAERERDIRNLQEQLTRHLVVFRELHHGEEDSPEERDEMTLFADLQKLTTELRELTDRSLSAGGRSVQLGPMDLAQLNIMAQQVARRVEDLNEIHRAKVTLLLQS